MTINEIIKNLDRTIVGKEGMLKGIDRNNVYGAVGASYLEINIDELKRIRADLLEVVNGQS